MNIVHSKINWEGFIPFPIIVILFLFTTLNSHGQEEEQFKKLKFGLSFGAGYFPEPDLTKELGDISFTPGNAIDFNYGINLNYDINRLWTINAGLNVGGYPIPSRISLIASDYPGCLDYDIDESKMKPITVDFLDLYLTAERNFFVDRKFNFSIIIGGSLKTVPNGLYISEIVYESNITLKEKEMLTVSVNSNPNDETLWGGIIGIGHYFNLLRYKDAKCTLLYNVASANVAEGYYEILYDTECYTDGKYDISGQYASFNFTYILGRPHKEKRIKNNDNQ